MRIGHINRNKRRRRDWIRNFMEIKYTLNLTPKKVEEELAVDDLCANDEDYDQEEVDRLYERLVELLCD